MTLPKDPVASLGIAGFADALRRGEITSEQAVEAYLTRIEVLDPLLSAYEQMDASRALANARAMDMLLASGVDLGPLMGLPVSVKDLFVVEGMTPHAGSNLPLQDRLGTREGTFIRALKSSGCVILGTTRMVEFALGITGHSLSRGTPWNPWDDRHHRLPGGSSSGAGVALASGLCALSIGSDTGGSVRVPAAMCGLFGLKTTVGLWPTDGAFPLEPNTDSIGLLTRTAQDAAIAFEALNARINPSSHPRQAPVTPGKLTLGVPDNYFLDGIDPEMKNAFEHALSVFEASGIRQAPVHVPNVDGRERYFPVAMPAHLLAWLGEEYFLANQERIDPIIRARIEKGLDIKAHQYLALSEERRRHREAASPLFDQVDIIVSPTTQAPPCRLSELDDPGTAMQAAMGMTRNTQPANYFDWCAVTLPMGVDSAGLPLGLQLNGPYHDDARLLAVAVALEALMPPLTQPKAFQGFALQ
ncbi:amidase [Halomonas korlensis]|uniref:Aspartyl-tRNA(Asn)/glutamyl-tRNA(Gln) amidotransferase subunit A n=1 Tax=Halomonas korlensis TaxID=463301 RepID=A0A1I7GKC8_9GAMM|nr:amidase [Halomonas korlensis]SFU48895.1 aspartyl-tRNA(Asn)/glutamyl-tRNA(Gln) amidotransferase subunit A [Halomonas korlensis]